MSTDLTEAEPPEAELVDIGILRWAIPGMGGTRHMTSADPYDNPNMR